MVSQLICHEFEGEYLIFCILSCSNLTVFNNSATWEEDLWTSVLDWKTCQTEARCMTVAIRICYNRTLPFVITGPYQCIHWSAVVNDWIGETAG